MANEKVKTATLGGTAWNDLNRDGLQNDGNIGIAGIKVLLLGHDGKATGKFTWTDASGNYMFAGLKPGGYSVKFDAATLPNGASFTQKHAGHNNNLDSDANVLTGVTSKVELHSGETNNSLDAGIVVPPTPVKGSIAGNAWSDNNFNGTQDAGEGVTPDFTIELYRADANSQPVGAVVQSVNVINGSYAFIGLDPGQYIVSATHLPAGYHLSKLLQGNDATLDSNINPANGLSGLLNVTSGEIIDNIDIGLGKGGSVVGYLWHDNNFNGLQDTGAGETGIANTPVVLNTAGGAFFAQVFTDSSGHYSFSDVPSGTYFLEFHRDINDSSYTTVTLRGQGTDRSIDSDIDPATAVGGSGGFSDQFTVSPGAAAPPIDVGYTKTPAISIGVDGTGGFDGSDRGVWHDLDADGIKEAGEPGLAGITVTLSTAGADGIAFTNDDIIRGSLVTTDTGNYRFDNLDRNSVPYYLSFSGLTGTQHFTKPHVGEISLGNGNFADVPIDSDVDVIDVLGVGHSTTAAGSFMISAGIVF